MVLSRWFAWKPLPLIVTVVPATPPSGQKNETDGGGTENTFVALLLMLLTLTIAGPLAAVTGTVATICVSDQLFIEAAGCPLNDRTLVPCEAPKPTPVKVTCVPTGPVEGERVLMTRVGTV